MKMQSYRILPTAASLAIGAVALLQIAHHATAAPNGKHPVLMIDRHEIIVNSKIGQDIHRQIMAYEDKVQADLGAQGQALQAEMQAAQSQPPSATRDKKLQGLHARETEYRQKLTARQSLIQGGELVARQHYLSELAAVVEAVMFERGADMVIEKPAVVSSVGGLDITNTVIQRLDSKASTFKVPLVNPPASSNTQMSNQ